MRPLPDPRLTRILQGLDQAHRLLDGLQTELVEYLREQGSTWEEIGEQYDPPKSRQALQKWFSVRRRRGAAP